MSDEPLYLPATFADESYPDNPKLPGAVVLAQFPDHADMTWHAALLGQMRTKELKFGRFRSNWDSLPADLVRRALKGMRSAMIAIVDDTEHTTRGTALLESALKRSSERLGAEQKRRFDHLVIGFASRSVLNDSPLGRVGAFVGGFDSSELVKDPRKARNVRIVAARAVGAFPELVDPRIDREKLIRRTDAPVFTTGGIDAHLLERSSQITRVFDAGNTLATGVIRSLRDRVRERLEGDFVESTVAATTEADSAQSVHVGASDLAAGYARSLYESSDGRKKVADAFDLVVLNGTALRA